MTTVVRKAARPRPVWHPLPVADVARLTAEAVTITFAVPPELRAAYAFLPGQHLTVRYAPDVRRSYSICSTPADLDKTGKIRIGVKEVPGGAFSSHGVRALLAGLSATGASVADVPPVADVPGAGVVTAGAVLEVLPPLGTFTTALDPARTRRYGAIVAGSGVTPVLSLIATALATEPASTFTLVYGNRATASVMFADELGALKDRYPARLQILHVLSREPGLSPVLSGRLDRPRLELLLGGLVPRDIEEWFLCGPVGLVETARELLKPDAPTADALAADALTADPPTADAPTAIAPTANLLDTSLPTADAPDTGVRSGPVVHTELFYAGEPPAVVPTGASGATGQVALTFRLDGRESSTTMSRDTRVLDAALAVRAELPYACKGGVCATCRARLTEGEVAMARNYALEPDDVAAGYILTCQSVPLTGSLTVDYDA
ncbi:2Fe-2S iron-sulfur cluster-binding protein [Catenuloplanes japonicus]|uniref:2Fe-2S iron-sulfur cluster-binding protein n=1 Tax=Catenuloplanes japonicus TaxID=33876 RepID=UPI000525D9A5|nr:2Fe-2S iron-sulfur cluster-binding protein [Catenuloplanes japonicus]